MVDITGETTTNGGTHQRYLGLTNYMSGYSKTYGGTSDDVGFSVVQTADGGYAIAGYTRYSDQTPDIYLVKTDSAGNMQWNKSYGGPDFDVGYSVVQTSDGGYTIAGYSYPYGAKGHDVYLVKTDAELGLAWTGSKANTITLYRGATDPYWNFVRVKIWKPKS